jgi:SH3-like domain-containing protein
VPSDQELTFVRLFTEASEGMGLPRHVVVKKDSRVEILSAKIKLSWDQSREVILFGVDDQDPWLKVRIDGQEGWIHTQEDFSAIGLPQTG